MIIIIWTSGIICFVALMVCIFGLVKEIEPEVVMISAITMVVTFWICIITWMVYEAKHPTPMEFPVDKYKLEYKIIQQGEKCDTIYVLIKNDK